jgi:WD40 repeat protein
MRACRVEPLILHADTDINCVAFSRDGRQLASAGGDGAIQIWDCRSGGVVQRIAAHPGYVSCVAFHPDGRHVASVGADRQVAVWDLTTGAAVFRRPCDGMHVYGTAYATAFSPDGRHLAAGNDGVVRLWDWRQDQVLQISRARKTRISVAFCGDGHGDRQLVGNDPALGCGPGRATVRLLTFTISSSDQ